jgi:hypothetical protein
VVVLDQRRVTQSHSVVDTAADAHRVLLQRPQPRQRLARVADLCVRPGHRLDPGRRRRRDAGQMADQVEHRPLGGQEPLRRCLRNQNHAARIEPLAVLDAVFQPMAVLAEHLIEHQ